MKCNFEPYNGNEPYIFISYSHKDDCRVAPILERLHKEGFKIWFDDGIDWGSEWPESIAEHLEKCSVFIAFHSENSVVSSNCQDEINFAVSKEKKILSVYLEETELSKGTDLRISRHQATYFYQYDNEEEFFERLINTKILKVCQNGCSADFQDNSAKNDKKKKNNTKKNNDKETKNPIDKLEKNLCIISMLLLSIPILKHLLKKLQAICSEHEPNSVLHEIKYALEWVLKIFDEIFPGFYSILIIELIICYVVMLNSEEYRKEQFKDKNFDLKSLSQSPEQLLNSVMLIPDSKRLNEYIFSSNVFKKNDIEKANIHFSDVKNTGNLIIASCDGKQTDYICWYPNGAYSFFTIGEFMTKTSVMYTLTEQGFAMTKVRKNIVFYKKDDFEVRVNKSFFNGTRIEICRKGTEDFSLVLPTILKDFSLSPKQLTEILKLHDIRLKADENQNFSQFYNNESITIASFDGKRTDYIFYLADLFQECSFLGLHWTDSGQKIEKKMKEYGFEYIKSEKRKMYFENEEFTVQILNFPLIKPVEICRKVPQKERFPNKIAEWEISSKNLKQKPTSDTDKKLHT